MKIKSFYTTPPIFAGVGDFFTSLKWAWQRATKGYCELDTYSIGDWLLHTLPDMLEEIKKKCVGYPDELTKEK